MYNGFTFSAVITAAGSGTRMKTDKMLLLLLGKSVICRTVDVFLECGFFDEIIVVASKNNIETISRMMPSDKIRVIQGGATRGESSLLGIKAAKSTYVMVHDGARPLVERDIIYNVASACIKHGAAATGVTPKDTVKICTNSLITSTVPRESCILIGTPQAFVRNDIEEAYVRFGTGQTDDCSLIEKTGRHIFLVEGTYENIKITTPEDVITAERILQKRAGEGMDVFMRIGNGFDTHRLISGRKLIIGGTQIPYEKGLDGHSDADVLIHAVIDALFGAAALGDIGTHFPDSSDEFLNISSMKLLSRTTELIKRAGYSISNIDTTIIAQAPKMAPYIASMRENLAQAMGIDISVISVKAKTNEKMGFTGRGEGIEARAVALLYKIK